MKNLTVFLAILAFFATAAVALAEPTTNPTSMYISPDGGKVGEPIRVTIEVRTETDDGSLNPDAHYKYWVNLGRYCASNPGEQSDPNQWLLLQDWTTETYFQTEPLVFPQEGKYIFIVWVATPEEFPELSDPNAPKNWDSGICPAMLGVPITISDTASNWAQSVGIEGSGRVGDIIHIGNGNRPSSEGTWWYKFWVNKISYCQNQPAEWELLYPEWSNVRSRWWRVEEEGFYTIVIWSTQDPDSSCVVMSGGSYRVK